MPLSWAYVHGEYLAAMKTAAYNQPPEVQPELGDLNLRTQVLIEALSYLKRFAGKTVVIKYGGHAMLTPELRSSFCQDVALLNSAGIKPIIVHGGGPQITELIARLGLKSSFVRGMRVTDEATMEAAEMVLQRLNKEITALISSEGARAIGLSGKDSGLLRSRQMRMVVNGENGKLEQVDIGLVGEIETVNNEVLTALRDAGFIPIIAPVGIGPEGQTYNINADVAAGTIAGSLRAEKLILLTDVPGVQDEKGALISVLDAALARTMIASGAIGEGMIPKVECCLEALSTGVQSTHILDGRVAHAVLLEIFTERGIGTEVRQMRAATELAVPENAGR
jgi:acetylglutamate kinase